MKSIDSFNFVKANEKWKEKISLISSQNLYWLDICISFEMKEELTPN